MLDLHFNRWPFLRSKRAPLSERAIGGISLAIAILAGSTFNGFAKSLSGTLSPLSLLFISEILTALFVLLSFGAVPTFRRYKQLHTSEFLWMLALGFCSGIAGPLLLFTGLKFTTAINAGFFAKIDMIFMMILAAIVIKERITSIHMAAAATILAGISTISLEGFTDGLTVQFGDLLIVLATFSYCMGSIIFRKKLCHIEPHIALFSRSMTAITAFFLLSPFISHPFIAEIGNMPAVLIPSLIGFAFISRFLNSVMSYQAIDRLPVTTVTLVASLDVIGSSLFSHLYLGEMILWYHYLGGAFIILGTLLLELRPHKTPEIIACELKQRAQHKMGV